MSKENILFTIIGVLAGFIVGFVFANSVNKSEEHNHAPVAATAATTAATTPHGPNDADHPALAQNAAANQGGGMPPDIQLTIDKARKEPDNYDAQLAAAELYFTINRHKGAIEFLERANSLRPENYEVIVNLANAHLQAGNYEEAEKRYTAALATHPEDVLTRSRLGSTFLHRQPPQIDRALNEFRLVLERDARHEETLAEMAYALSQKGDAQAAENVLAQLEQINPQNESIPQLRASLTQTQGSSSN